MSPSPEQVGVWVLVAIALLPTIKMIVEWSRGGKQKREVSFETEYATAAALENVQRELGTEIERVDNDVKSLKQSIQENGERRRAAIEAKVEDARKEARQEVAGLHEKINKVDRAVAGVQASHDMQRQVLAQISNKLDQVGGKHG
jgi:chromosome segregation ATPase